VDSRRNNVSLIETLERISFPGPPVELPEEQVAGLPFPVELVSFWTRSNLDVPETGHARIQILSPEGIALIPDEAPKYVVNLEQHQRFRLMAQITVLPFVGNGIYRFVVQYFDEKADQWQTVASVPLEIVMETSSEESPPDLDSDN
jgi:hypothetical protein